MELQEHVSLRNLTTLKIGGSARYFVVAKNVPEFEEAVSFARTKNIPLVVLGGGSNILVGSGEINALVAKIDIRGVDWTDNGQTVLAVAGAGENWDGLVAQTVERGLWGIENLSGIPGSVGAAPIQNIGAYGAEIKDILEWVEAFDTGTKELTKLSNEDCRFGYRDSLFKSPKGKRLIVTRVALRLKKNGAANLGYKDLQKYFYGESHSPFVKGSTSTSESKEGFLHPSSHQNEPLPLGKGELPTLSDIRRAVLNIRSKKFPDLNEFGTAGSFFKNPIVSQAQFDELKERYPDIPGFELKIKDKGLRIKISLAWILDHICGLKGYEKGNVKLFEKQPIVLVQNGLASAEEIEIFAEEVAKIVQKKTGIAIEWEVQKIF